MPWIRAAPKSELWVIAQHSREQCQRKTCSNRTRKASKVPSYLNCLDSAQKVRHAGFSRDLLPRPHDRILKNAGVTPLKELQCLENPSGAFDESSWVFVSVPSTIYVARGMSCHASELNDIHTSYSPRLFSERWWNKWPTWVEPSHSHCPYLVKYQRSAFWICLPLSVLCSSWGRRTSPDQTPQTYSSLSTSYRSSENSTSVFRGRCRNQQGRLYRFSPSWGEGSWNWPHT